jgi:putative ABC transport system permease protein
VLDLRARATVFEEVAAYDEWTPTLAGGGVPERLHAASVTSPFFRVLGVRPALGRFFRPDEDRPGHDPAVVLSHGLWRRRFGADPGIVGRTVELSGTSYTVAGVAPAGFEDPGLHDAAEQDPQLWRVTPGYFAPESSARDGRAFTAVARLKPGATLEQGRAEAASVARWLAQSYPEDDTGRGMELVSLKEEIVAPVRPALLALLAAAGFVLLIACANVANLLLARAESRSREIAVRTALGATRGRVARQLLTESVLLALLGGAAGAAVAAWAADSLVALGGAGLARGGQIRLDGRVLAFTAGASVLTGLLFGLAPLLRGASRDLQATLRAGAGGTAAPAGRRIRQLLVAGEVAVSVLLLVCAGLMVRSLWSLGSVDPGMETGGVLALEVTPPFGAYDSDEKLGLLYGRIQERLEALPGVVAVGSADILPMSGDFNGMQVDLAGRPAPRPGEELSVETRVVTPGFFAALGIPTVRGRVPAATEALGSPAPAVVDLATARKLWPGEEPLGKRFRVYGADWVVAGVVGDTRQFSLERAPEPTLYLPRARAQEWIQAGATVLVRTEGDPTALAAAARAAVREVDPAIPVSDVRTMEQVVDRTTAAPRLRAVLLGVLAGLAFALGVVGIYGTVSYGVARRVPELGIRMALGARGPDVVRMVVREGMAPVALGTAVGLAAALAAGRALSGFLFGTPAYDPLTFAAAAATLAATACLACWLPARRAARVDPMVALRTD